MSEYTSFYLNAPGTVAEVNCIEIKHPTFSFFLQSYDEDTFAVTHENGQRQFYVYLPMQIDRSNVNNDLEQVVKMTINDFDDRLIEAYNNIQDKRPVEFRQRIYRDNNLDSPMIVLQTLHVTSMSKDSKGNVTFEAKAPELNSVRTGDTYTFERFPMLRYTI
ncbi:DUF1833 family protein [Acinetobacter larvae]|uniref:DUF1833 domain-containing protein n=1 Tax=Acinetobacter larvae TaxID=1789224 RepID=A0A1B2LZ60_9GAMM|nr:DUF1833 family protein [Acinetobacter larvae]AOA58238.1 hypothetical protein BFG52_07645 [Acinetobacter larvae]